MADWRLDQKTEETPQGTDLSMLVRGTSVFKTTFQKIKEFIIGTTTMGTTATDVTGAVKELNDKIGSAEKEGSITAQLNDIANENLIINGCPDIWQRGIIFENVQQYTADRWMYICSDTDGIPKGSLCKDNDGSMKITNFNNSQNYIQQIIETNLASKLAGKKITLSVDIKVSNMINGSLFLQMVSSTAIDKIDYSNALMEKIFISNSDVSNNYKRLNITFTVPLTAKTIAIQIGSTSAYDNGIVNNDCIVNLKDIKLELGKVSTAFIYRQIGFEKILCERYGQIRSTDNVLEVDLKPSMRISPTVTKINNGYFYDSEIY